MLVDEVKEQSDETIEEVQVTPIKPVKKKPTVPFLDLQHLSENGS